MSKIEDLTQRVSVLETELERTLLLLNRLIGIVGRNVERLDPANDERFYWLRNNAYILNWDAVEQLTAGDPTIHQATNMLGETALHFLVVENDLEAVEGLAKYGSDVNGSDGVMSPIETAANMGYPGMVDLLIRLGAKVDPEAIMQAAYLSEKKAHAKRIKKVLQKHGFLT